MQAFGGGVNNTFGRQSMKFKSCVNLTILLIYLRVLALYSVIVYVAWDKSKLGILVSVIVIVSDFFVFMLFNSKAIERPFVMIILVSVIIIDLSRLMVQESRDIFTPATH